MGAGVTTTTPTTTTTSATTSASASASEQSQTPPELNYNDDGSPSSSPHKDLQRVIKLIQQERHLTAHALYTKTLATIQTNPTSAENIQARLFASDNEKEFYKLQQHAYIFQRAKINATQDDDWIQCHVHHNVVSSYRREEDGSLSLKVEGDISGLPLFEQVAVMREVDLYHVWAPFTTHSAKLAVLGSLDQVAWFKTGIPKMGMVRDSCYRAIGCDNMMESGEVIVVAQGLEDGDTHSETEYLDEHDMLLLRVNSSIDTRDSADVVHVEVEHTPNSGEFINNFLQREAIMETIELPPRPKGWNKDRLQLKFFEAVIQIKSPTTATTRLVANINPKIKLPQFMIDFIMKHMCGFLLIKLQEAAKRAQEDHENSPHAIRMRDDSFYSSWLLPKFESYCRRMGWEMPQVNALRGLEVTRRAPFDHLETCVSMDDASAVSRVSLGSKFTSWKKKISNITGDSSVQSAPVVLPSALRVNPPSFSARQQQRLDDLKRFSREMGGESSAMGELRTSIAIPVAKERVKRLLGNIVRVMNDYSHLTVIPLLFLVMIVSFYAVSHEGVFLDDRSVISKLIGMLMLLFIFGCLHWAVMETVLVSTFDTIDLPVPKFTGDNKSSSTRHYVIQQIGSYTTFFSKSLGMMAISKSITVQVLRGLFSLIRWVVTIGKAEKLASQSFGAVCNQVLHDTKSMMTYSAVFVSVCCMIAVVNFPSKAGKRINITHRPGLPAIEVEPAGAANDDEFVVHPPVFYDSPLNMMSLGSITEEPEMPSKLRHRQTAGAR